MRALWSDRQNCSHNVSQNVKRIRHFSEKGLFHMPPIRTPTRCLPIKNLSHFSLQNGWPFAGIIWAFGSEIKKRRISPKFSCIKLICEPLGSRTSAPSGQGRPSKRTLFFSERWGESVWVGTSVRARNSISCALRKLLGQDVRRISDLISARTSTGYPAQMDAEGLGHKLLLTPLDDRPKPLKSRL